MLRTHDVTVSDVDTPILHSVPLHLEAGEPVVMLGETGSGKSLLAQAIMGTAPRELWARGRVSPGPHRMDAARPGAFRGPWSREIAVLAQEPWLALDPLMRAVAQVAEAHRLVHSRSAGDAAAQAAAV